LVDALADCNEALRLRPSSAEALDSRGLVHLKLNRAAEAVTDYDAALRVDSRRAHSLYGRGLAKQKTGDAAGGVADINAAQAIQADIDATFASYGRL
jgi:tetratricopeptide (TPR) repeat protein